MKPRTCHAEDYQAIEEIHRAMGLDYKMPDLDSRLVMAKEVIEDDDKVIAGAMLKVYPEAYLWVQPSLSPIEKWDAIRMLQVRLLRDSVGLGFERVVAYVPSIVNCHFAKRLRMLGWKPSRDGWFPWVREVNQP